MTTKLTKLPKGLKIGLLSFPFCGNLEDLKDEIAILGIPYGLPYYPNEFANGQSLTPYLIRQNAKDSALYEPRTIKLFDWDLGGDLLNGSNICVVDCGNVTSDIRNPREHYNRAEKAMKKIFESAKTLVNIDADGLESTIMQAVNSPTPGGLN